MREAKRRGGAVDKDRDRAVAFTIKDDAAKPTAASRAERDNRGETHFEWLARIVLEEDRRLAPFTYGEPATGGERRRWDLRKGLFAAARTRRALLQDG
ncbi:hypothetical protein [Sphingomonas sp. MMS24-J13]|uniref:hypothetical protein n=1 Tax=Sphingomonas sp. MMS24-J13 TaxID=3238686 RepID=UPI00384BAE6E